MEDAFDFQEMGFRFHGRQAVTAIPAWNRVPWSDADGLIAVGGGDDDRLDFLGDSEEGAPRESAALPPWIVLIVDDDHYVHEATSLVLAGERIHGRGLRFLHAYSAAEARDVVTANPGVALILLDVVMETPDAGLRLVPVIREELGRADIRIIIRTGQPGYAPESEIAGNRMVDGYLMKAQSTRAMLIDALVRALEGGEGRFSGS